MRKVYLIVFATLLSQVLFSQIVKWTFETSIPVTAGPHAAEIGTGSASGLHASGSTVYSNPAGNGSVESFSSNFWAINDYYQFQFASTGFQDLNLTWDATSSATGPRDFKVQYSIDGVNFTDATGTNSSYQHTTETWSSGSSNPASIRSLDLSYATVLNNAASVYIRLIVTSGTAVNTSPIATTGTSRIDNVTINGNVFSTNTISVTSLSSPTFSLPDCFTSAPGTVDFTSVGTFNGANVYTAQLSDGLGAFTTPIDIGTLSSTGNSGTINIVIPAGSLTGTLYKIRIRSSDPVITSNLSADITINQAGSCASSATDFFRSRATGNWNAVSTWESSATGTAGTWLNATLTPTNAANTISILNGHTVSVTASVNVDQVVIESGGILNHTGGTITVEDGSGDDINIQNGGIFRLALVSTPPAYGAGSPTINVSTGGILRASAGGMTGAATGVNSSNIIYNHQSILEWAPTGTGSFSSGGVTYFPNVDAVTIPIFRSSNTLALQVGAAALTIINGVFEAAGNTVTWENGGTKTFRNGIRGNALIDGQNGTSPSGQFIINGVTAEIGGTGLLIVPSTVGPVIGLEIGSASGTTVSVSNNKVITGDISLTGTNTFVDLGTSNLTVSGTISGGTATRYVRTTTTGALILNTVDAVGKTFPVGHTQYNPIVIANGSNHNWTVNVNDGVVADLPQTNAGAVLLTWNITPSVNPPSAGADITFQFDAATQTGGSFNVSPYDIEPVQAWHRKLGYWLASGTPAPLVNIGGNLRTVTGLGLTQFSPYGLARVSLPLPLKLISFSATKINTQQANLAWELAVCCSEAARFEIEKSTDGRNYVGFKTVTGSATNRFYLQNDTRLGKGITYYRLRMIDADGTVGYSKVVAIINDGTGFVITGIAPNPIQSTATLTISAAKQEVVSFAVYNLSGALIKTWTATVKEGNNAIPMQIGELPAAIYHLQATGQDAKSVIRFVKQ